MFSQTACRTYQQRQLWLNTFKHSLRVLTCLDSTSNTMRTLMVQGKARLVHPGNVLHRPRRLDHHVYRGDHVSEEGSQTYRDDEPYDEDDQFVQTSPLEQMKDRIRTDPIVPLAEWKLLEENMQGNSRLRISWECSCMNSLRNAQSLDGALLFLEYIRGQGRKPNVPTLACLIDLCVDVGDSQDLIFTTYKELLTHTDIFDTSTAKSLICGFAITEDWKKCFEFLEMVKFLQKPVSCCYSPIAIAALREGDYQMAHSVIETMGKAGIQPSSAVFLKYIEVSSIHGSEVTVDKLFDYLTIYQWFINDDVANAVHKLFLSNQTERWSSCWAVVSKSGHCTSCSRPMNKVYLSDFKHLQDAFKKNVLLGEDVYLKSSPEEVDRFISFMEDNGPFDICIDYLNLHKFYEKQRLQVLDAIRYFDMKKRKRVLVIGRKHLLKSRSNRDMQKAMEHSKFFFTENSSKDDPFFLYATLFSGPHAMFVSQDEMRDHKFALGEDGKLFQKWQRSQQIYPTSKGFKMPTTHDTFAQRSFKGWHIPYEDGSHRFSYQHSNKWLCLQRM